MKTRARLLLATGILFSLAPARADEAAPVVKDPIDSVLATDPDALAEKLGLSSEAGYDQAARIWATAKRLETEGKLARDSVRRVLALAELRSAVDDWQDLQLEIVSMEMGGGTMWGHMGSRNDVGLERLLAEVADGVAAEPTETAESVAEALESLVADSRKWLDRVAKEDEFGMARPEWVASIRKQLPEFQGRLGWALGHIKDPKAAGKILDYCRGSMEVGK